MKLSRHLVAIIVIALSFLTSSCIERFKSGGQPGNEYNISQHVYIYDEYLKGDPQVKVMLLKKVKEFSIAINSPFEIYSMQPGQVQSGINPLFDSGSKMDTMEDGVDYNRKLISKHGSLLKTEVTLSGTHIQIGTISLNREAVEISAVTKGSITVNDTNYWGKVHIVPQVDDTFMVIEETELEDYLEGVIGREMPSSWTKNTLFAQAVAARTFALFQKKKHKNGTYHLSKLDMSYGGRDKEEKRTRDIINKSKGIIMVYDWLLFPGYFHSTCGGYTEDVNLVFKEKSIPPLSGVMCENCGASKYYRWETDIDKDEFAQKLSNYKVKVSRTLSVKPLEPGKGGHATTISVSDSSGTKNIEANTFRLLIGPNKLYSTAFYAKSNTDSIKFTGRGWGHGVGLCQYGAQKMGISGSKWYEILKHYYPKIDLVKIY